MFEKGGIEMHEWLYMKTLTHFDIMPNHTDHILMINNVDKSEFEH